MSVGFKFQDVERVDFITYNRDQEFRCYEIKVSKSDFLSNSKLSFVGDFNYLVIPDYLLEEIEDTDRYRTLLFSGVGVFTVCSSNQLTSIRKAKKKSISFSDQAALLESMVRSMDRDLYKYQLMLLKQ